MPNQNKPQTQGWLAKFRHMPNDSTAKVLIVAVLLCLVCSIFVSSAAVLLRPLQEANEDLARRIEILRVAGLYEEGANVANLFQQVTTRIIDLETGEYVDHINPTTYDYDKASKLGEHRMEIPDEKDIAGINTKARYAPVYLVKDNDSIQTIILPVHGYGLWSTMYAFLALEGNANTVRGVSFYQHGETPGLGGEISNPQWQARWTNRNVFDDKGTIRLRVIDGNVNPSSSEAIHQIDGISGATLTVNGVNNMIQFWLGEQGFGPYLARIRNQEV